MATSSHISYLLFSSSSEDFKGNVLLSRRKCQCYHWAGTLENSNKSNQHRTSVYMGHLLGRAWCQFSLWGYKPAVRDLLPMVLESNRKKPRNKTKRMCAARASEQKLFEVRIYLSKYLLGSGNTHCTMETNVLKRVKENTEAVWKLFFLLSKILHGVCIPRCLNKCIAN